MSQKEHYPHFISTNPIGVDLLDGQSQEMISKAIANHIIAVDSGENVSNMPRVIGIEGSWGSGKSNVLYRLEHKDLADDKDYVFFLYDAWANQEDLQRRSILELLTDDLLHGHDEPILYGKTKVSFQIFDKNQSKGYRTIEENVDWQEKLDMLMARRVKNISRSVSPLNTEFKLLMLDFALTPIAITLMNCLKFKDITGWIYFAICLIVAFLPTIVIALIIACTKKFSFTKAFQAYQSKNEDKTVHQVINEADPTIREFTSWMMKISEGIGAHKLIIVFDNMDRLPDEKVRQLWSSIHSLFSSAEYNNIWCIIPYDFVHLMNAFSRDEQITKYFIQKSFPVTYRIPEPAIIDYKNLFNKFFKQAFGEIVSSSELESINSIYRAVRQKPNIRETITFINRFVELKNQWGDSLSNICMAVYLLREDTILRHPGVYEKKSPSTKGEIKQVSTDTYLLSNDIIQGLPLGSINREKLYTELAALVYGIKPDDAYQVVMQNALRDCLSAEDNNVSINDFAQRHHFGSVLQEVVNSLLPHISLKLLQRLDQLSIDLVDEESKPFIPMIWERFAVIYCRYLSKETAFDESHRILLDHVDSSNQSRVLKAFVNNIAANGELNGEQTFAALRAASEHKAAEIIKTNELFAYTKIEPKRFIEFVESAKEDYAKFGLSANNNLLCVELNKMIGASFSYNKTIELLSKDKSYDLSNVFKLAKARFQEQKVPVKEAYSYIRLLKNAGSTFDAIVESSYIIGLWNEVQSVDDQSVKEEIYTLYVNLIPENNMSEPFFSVDKFAQLSFFYNSTAEQIENFINNPGNQALRALVGYLIKSRCHDNYPVNTIVKYLDVFINYIPAIDKEDVLTFLDSWGVKQLSESDESLGIQQLLPTVGWIDTMISTKTELGKAIIAKAVTEMESQNRNQYYDVNLNPVGTYWSSLLERFVNTKLLHTPLASSFHEICSDILKRIAQNQQLSNPTLLALFGMIRFREFNSELREISKNFLNHVAGYSVTPYNFKLMHLWLEKLGIDKAEVFGDTADYIIAPIITDSECQTIIMSNKEFYAPLIKNAEPLSFVLRERLQGIAVMETEFAGFINEILPELNNENKELLN